MTNTAQELAKSIDHDFANEADAYLAGYLRSMARTIDAKGLNDDERAVITEAARRLTR